MSSLAGGLVPRAGAEIAIAHEFRPPPYGGSNQFLLALRGELERQGHGVEANRIGRGTRACILNAFLFDVERIARSRRPGCRMVHRVDGPVGMYRGTDDGADRRVEEINRRLADVTVFQSTYSLEATRALGLELVDPVVVTNAVDPGIFHPGDRVPLSGGRLRVIATSWSDNRRKGAGVYEWLDEHLDTDRVELTFVGRSPVEFRRIRMLPPVPSHELAGLLREHDAYLTASENDPCSNALIEALATGLPALYLRSGGHPELAGEGGLGFDAAEEIPALLDRLAAEHAQLRSRIRVASLADVARSYLEVMGLAGGA